MADRVTRAKRSKIMASVRGSGNVSTEKELVRILRESKIKGWKRKNTRILGRPDLVFMAPKISIFTDGCFWHGCARHSSIPKTNVRFWKNKIATNRRRDRRVDRNLKKDGWAVLRFWEHDIKKNPDKVVRRIKFALAARARRGK